MIEELKERYALALRKREELEASLEDEQVHDPVSIAISVAISASLAAASYLVATALAPTPPKRELGKLTGSLQLMNSEQGIMIPEIYGAGPTVSLVAGSNPTYADIANCTQGGGGSFTKTSGGSAWNGGGSHNTSVTSGDAFYRFTVGTGYAGAGFSSTSTIRNSGTDFLVGLQWNPDSSVTLRYSGTLLEAGVAHWATGDEFTIEIRSGRFRFYKGSAEIIPTVALPTPTYPLYMGVAIYTSGAGVSASKIQIGSIGDPPNYGVGGVKVPAIIIWTSGIRKIVTTTHVGGGKGFGGGGGQTVENITYNIDLGCKFAAHGPHRLIREYANADVLIDQMDESLLPTGVYDATTGADVTYDPLQPPDPQLAYQLSMDRLDADIPFDGDGTGDGVIQGGGSGFKIYTGTATQDPDPTIEADVDARYGTGSTPAYRNHSYIVHNTFDLSRWGGVVPNITAVWEHDTLKTLSQIYGALCERVNVKAADSDYDFSGLSTINSRGLLIAGRLFSPAEIMGSPDIQTVYNYFVTEAEGQIVGYVEGAEPSVTIPDTEVGWMDADTEVSDILPEVDSFLAPEIDLPRQIDVKYIDPQKDWDGNTQSDNRQITEGVSTELLEVQLTLLPDEARAAAQRRLYQGYVGGTAHKFTLPWKYLYLYPGYKVTITRAEGFTHVMKLTSVTGGIGILECEGVALEPAAFTQPAVGSGGPPWIPPLPVPAMTILTLLDTPLLRDGDETNNYGIGFYMAGVKRTSFKQKWQGYNLYVNRNSEWISIATSTREAIIGTISSANSIGLGTDYAVIDHTGNFVVDLYGTTAILESITEAVMLADATKNVALVGDMVIQFATASQVPGYPNRWVISTLLNGRRGTEKHITDTFTNKRFLIINDAVKFVPARLGDRNSQFDYKAVTVGQSLGDAATVQFAWTGNTLKPLAPVIGRGKRDTLLNLLITWIRRSRLAPGFIPGSDVPLGEEQEMYDVEILTSLNVVLRTMRVFVGSSRPAVLVPAGPEYAPYVSGNNILPGGTGTLAYAEQRIESSGDYIEATLVVGATGSASVGFVNPAYTPQVGYSLDGLTNIERFSVLYTRDPLAIGGPGLKVSYGQTTPTTTLYTSGLVGPLTNATIARIRIMLSGSEIRCYWDYTGPASVPFFVVPTGPSIPVSPVVFIGGTASEVRNVIVGNTGKPSVIYSLEQQIEDFGSAQPAIKVRVYQISSIVGRGDYGERTI